MKVFEKIYQKLLPYLGKSAYINYLRKKGVSIGTGTCLFNLPTINIDLSRPSLISIGDNVSINRNFTLVTHDFVSGVFIHKYHDFLPSSGRVSIGNNVRFGVNCTVLKDVNIGDNVFIAAGSIVSKDIQSNCIAGGTPCRPLISLDDYYAKRKVKCINEALEYALSIQQRFARKPKLLDFWEEFPLFVDGDKIDQYPDIANVIKAQLGPAYQNYVKNHKAIYKDFEDFLSAAGVK